MECLGNLIYFFKPIVHVWNQHVKTQDKEWEVRLETHRVMELLIIPQLYGCGVSLLKLLHDCEVCRAWGGGNLTENIPFDSDIRVKRAIK